MEPIPFPKDVDAPGRFLFWTFDQVVPFALMALIGMLTQMLFICLIIGGALSWAFSRYRDSRPDGYLQHAVYWYGILPLKGRAAVNPFQRTIYPS